MANLYVYILFTWVCMCLSRAIWHPVAREQLSRSETVSHLCGLAVGSKPLVRVINLCNGPIRLQFRRLMTARCVTARAGLSADWVVAFMPVDKRKQAGWTQLSKEKWHISKIVLELHSSEYNTNNCVHILLFNNISAFFVVYSSDNHLNFTQCNIPSNTWGKKDWPKVLP